MGWLTALARFFGFSRDGHAPAMRTSEATWSPSVGSRPAPVDERFVGVMNRYPGKCARCGQSLEVSSGFLSLPPWRVTCFACYLPLVEGRGFAVVDLETTGLSPQTSRIVELAVIRLDGDGRPVEEYETLINPGTQVRATHVHGIKTRDVRDAPQFSDVIGDVARLLRGAFIVAHNGEFDSDFLSAECRRAGHEVGALPYICTIRATTQLGITTPTRKLADCCRALGVPYERGHMAVSDARATAALFSRYLAMARAAGPVWRSLPVGGNPELVAGLPSLPPSGRRLSRLAEGSAPLVTSAAGQQMQSATAKQAPAAIVDLSLGERIQRGLPEDLRAGTFAPYFDLLDRVLEDGEISDDEVGLLRGWAQQTQVSAQELADANARYVRAALADALSDGRMTKVERGTVETLAGHLGVEGKVMRRMEREVRAARRA